MLPLGLSESRFAGFLEEYMQTLDYGMRLSFGSHSAAIQRMEEGYENHYLKFVNSSDSIEGLVLINVDHTFQDATRVYIRHISVKNRANFGEVLQQACEFGWTKMLADHIRVDLLHVKD